MSNRPDFYDEGAENEIIVYGDNFGEPGQRVRETTGVYSRVEFRMVDREKELADLETRQEKRKVQTTREHLEKWLEQD